MNITSPFAIITAAALVLPVAQAAPLLRCQLSYGGSTQTLEATPVANPYGVASVDVGGRFRFKAIVLGTDTQPETIKLYAYVNTPQRAVLVQQATYRAPFPLHQSLTGHQFLYAGPQEREFQYDCGLQGDAP